MSIYMFHYVKPCSNYYHFNLNKFEEFVKSNKNKIISLKDYIKSNNKENEIVLTFDDGTLDHYENVFPILKKYGVTGVFSVCDNIISKEILNIQKIHYLMGEVGIEKLFYQTCSILNEDEEFLISKYNSKENAVKKLLQKDLEMKKRKEILDELLKINNMNLKFEDLYINKNQMQEMIRDGNEFIYHTKNHCWLGSLNYNEQENELKNAKDFIKDYKFENMLTFPFGDYDENTLKIAQKLGIDLMIGVNYTNTTKCLTRVDCSALK